MKIYKLVLAVIILSLLSCSSEQKKNYFTLTTDSKRLNTKNRPGLLIVADLNNKESARMSELIAENLKRNGVFRIDSPIEYIPECTGADNIFSADDLNRPFITKEGKLLIRKALQRLDSKFIFFLNVSEDTRYSANDISFVFNGILVGSCSEIIGVSSFEISKRSSHNPEKDLQKLLIVNAILIADAIITNVVRP